MVQVTNALFDARIASESAPLTRDMDIDALFPAADNTEQIRVKCLTDNGFTVQISYEELLEDDIWAEMVAVADGFTTVIDAMDDVLSSVHTMIGTFTPPYTYENWRDVIRALQVPALNPIKGV